MGAELRVPGEAGVRRPTIWPGGGGENTKQTQRCFSRQLWGLLPVRYAGPHCAFVVSLPPGLMVRPVCRYRVWWGSRGCVGTRGRGTEGDFNPELLLV